MTDLDQAADELYALGPAELDGFASRRAELVAAARSDGDRDLARQIGALKKPVQAAALCNALVRARPVEVAELGKLGRQLREAHRQLRGKQLRELSEQRQRLLGKLVQLSRAVAGREIGETVLNQLRATLEAAIADEGAEAAVRSGRLTAALSYSGFGEVDVSDAVAVPRRLKLVPDLPATDAEQPEQADGEPAEAEQAEAGPDPALRREAERAAAQAESAATAAAEAVRAAADQLAEAHRTEQQLSERIRNLQAELVSLRADAAAAAKATTAAEREHARTVRAGDRADRAQRLATAALRSLTDD